MRWWKHLYMGDRAMKNRPNVLRGIREGKVMPDTYVITLPESGNHTSCAAFEKGGAGGG